MVVKAEGPFVWHKHADTDTSSLLSKAIPIGHRDRTVNLGPGELFIVPRGVKHRPVAKGEAHVLLIEPRGTPNTGDLNTAARRL